VPEFELRVAYHQPTYGDVVVAPLRSLQPIYDAELALPNPIDVAHLKLSRGTRLAHADRDLKPLTAEVEQLNRIVSYPPTRALETVEKTLLWQYRYYLRGNPRALTKFLRAVDFKSVFDDAFAAVVVVHLFYLGLF
jgi:phosphatidylinositol 3-kinase